MSETEADRAYYAAGEAAFIRRRGTPFLLSPRDFALLKQWRALGVPIEAVEQGIDDAFSRREERGATGKVNSLSYCRDAVLAAWERRAESAVGRGEGREAAPDAAAALARLPERSPPWRSRRPDLGSRSRRPRARSSGSQAGSASRERSRSRWRASTASSPRRSTRRCLAEERAALDAGIEKQLSRCATAWTRRRRERTGKGARPAAAARAARPAAADAAVGTA